MNESKLVKKLSEVMAAVGRIPKRGRNEFHKYDYATEADIVEAIRSELASRFIMLFPAVTGTHREPVGDKGQVLTTLEMKFTFVDGETGEKVELQWAGAGTDKEDKGCYKALTGATKYFLLKTFLIPTGDDPEKDEPPKKKEPERKEPEKKEESKDGIVRITSKQAEYLWEYARNLFGDRSPDFMKRLLADYGVTSTNALVFVPGADPKDPKDQGIWSYMNKLSYYKTLEDEKK